MFGQRVQLWWDLPLIDSFDLLRHVYRVPAERYQENLSEFRELLELDPFIRTPVRQLSLGQRIRGELTAAMLHDPEIYDGDVDALKEQYGPERILVVDLVEPAPPLDIEGGRVIRVDGPRQWIAFARARTSAAELTARVAERVALRDLAIEEPDIEDVVRRIYAGTARGPRASIA